jgi:alpha-methylacyl-CoA racemase
MVGDFGGGGMFLAFGMVSAILHAQRTGEGQVVDCAMVDGAAVLMSMIWSFRAAGFWRDERGVNLLDTGAHFYDTYETADGKYLAVGAIEPQFYAELRRLAELQDDADLDGQMNFPAWPQLKEKLAAVFRSRTRDAWMAVFDGTDACVAPVLSLAEAPLHPHNAARGTFVEAHGVTQPAPAPRFSATPSTAPRMATGDIGADTGTVLAGIGYDPERIAGLKRDRILG